MAPASAPVVGAPQPPRVRLSLGVTGHRVDNAAYAANEAAILRTIGEICGRIDDAVAAMPPLIGHEPAAPTRLHALLADGADQAVADEALRRGWELVAPLPFGLDLNIAVNARPADVAEARAMAAGGAPASAETRARADRIRDLAARARVFALADQDDFIRELYFARLEAPGDTRALETFSAHTSERVGLAGRVMIEQTDIMLAVWDGASQVFIGGTGHTVAAALEMGEPVVWIDARAPDNWRILRTTEALIDLDLTDTEDRAAGLASLVRNVLRPAEAGAQGDQLAGVAALDAESWRARSDPLWEGYRRVEVVFGGAGRPLRNLRQTYEAPAAAAAGSYAELVGALEALPGADPTLVPKLDVDVFRRFAWADGISARLSDAYRGGMIANFALSACAIVAGVIYLPFGASSPVFPLIELSVLGGIILITSLGQRRRWHRRWFETRRVAEYFRHAPIMLALGVARPPGRWPRGSETSWPEWYARFGLREVGLPAVSLSKGYLRGALRQLLDDHVTRQRDYHYGKAKRLTNVHHNLDGLSERLFGLAIVSVITSLALSEADALALVSRSLAAGISRWFTFLDVVLPTLGGAIAGVRYFGDFERFAAISEITAKKLDALHARITPLLAAPDEALEYGLVGELAHAADEIVVSEIENWQAVFGSKNITVPT